MNGLRLLAASLVVLAGLTFSGHRNLACQEFYRDDMSIFTRTSVIKAEVAHSEEDKVNGLSGRDCIGPSQGMLFVYKQSGNYPFWMKDMRFAIDIIWINSGHRVVKVQPFAAPATYPKTFQNDQPAKYVLELKGGQAAKVGIRLGSHLQFVNP